MEGSMTLHHWSRLATPHLGTLLEERPGVATRETKSTHVDTFNYQRDFLGKSCVCCLFNYSINHERENVYRNVQSVWRRRRWGDGNGGRQNVRFVRTCLHVDQFHSDSSQQFDECHFIVSRHKSNEFWMPQSILIIFFFFFWLLKGCKVVIWRHRSIILVSIIQSIRCSPAIDQKTGPLYPPNAD